MKCNAKKEDALFMKKFEINEYIITTEKFKNNFSGYKFAVISDLHSNVYKVDLDAVYDAVCDAGVDAVLLCGDIFNGKPVDDIAETMAFVKKLADKLAVFMAFGNHEYRLAMNPDIYGDKIWQIIDALEENGVVILSDETIILEKDNEQLALSGLEIDTIFYKRRPPVMGEGLVKMHLGDAKEDVFHLLMAHNPRYFQNYAQWGADLVLSGHVHGGTVRLFGKKGVIGTDFRLFPKYCGGMYEEFGSKMIVSRGLGTHTIKVRIGNRPELIMVKILAKEQ